MVPKTILVTGLARSGTSVTAGIVHHLGCNMRPHPNPSVIAPRTTFEDKELHSWCEVVAKEGMDQRREGLLLGHIQARNAASPVWGWKSGGIIDVLGTLLPFLRNPFVIWVWRDPLHGSYSTQTSLRVQGEQGTGKKNLQAAARARTPLERVLLCQAARIHLMAKQAYTYIEVPHVHVSFSDVKADLVKEVYRIAEATELEVTPEALVQIKAMFIPGYSSWGRTHGEDFP